MRRIIVAALLAIAALGFTAAPAHADERTCYSPQVLKFDSFEVCMFLPVEPTS